MLLAVDSDKDFIDIESVTITSMLSFQAPSVYSSKFDTPKSNRFTANGDASFSQEIFNIAVAEVEAMIETDGVGNYVGWEPVSFVGIHPGTINDERLSCQYPPEVVLLAIYLHEDFIDVEGVAVASMLTLQPAGVRGTKFDTP